MSDRESEVTRLYHDADMPAPETVELFGGQAVVMTRRCPGHDGPNEDAAGIVGVADAGSVLMVADGMGGGKAGEQASRSAVQALGASIRARDGDDAVLRVAIMDGIEKANQSVTALGLGAATTLSLVEISSGCVRYYHVGDSLVLVVGQRGRIKLQSIAHSPVGFAIEAGHLEEDEALHHDDRHVVSNMLGGEGMRLEVASQTPLAPRDTVLLASDGLSDNLAPAEIVELLRKGPLEQAVQQLADRATERMTEPQAGEPSKPDDLTLIAYRQTTAPRAR